jgi:hypothetical protein
MPEPGCEHPAESLRKDGPTVSCSECAEDVTWPEPLRWVARKVESLLACDLPAEPWTLHARPSDSGAQVRVTDNCQWIRGLRYEVDQGADGPRYKTGAVQHDLYSLARILREREPARRFF